MNEFELSASEEQAEVGVSVSGYTIKRKKGRIPVSWAWTNCICTIQVLA
jgi:hypothetical protein